MRVVGERVMLIDHKQVGVSVREAWVACDRFQQLNAVGIWKQ